MTPPDPNVVHPMPGQPRVVLLKPLVTSPLIEVGGFSYYDEVMTYMAARDRAGHRLQHRR